MEKVEQLQAQLNELLDKIQDKELVADIASINKTVEEVKAENEGFKKENRELLSDYKDLIKATGVSRKDDPAGPTQAPTFEEAIQKVLNERK